MMHNENNQLGGLQNPKSKQAAESGEQKVMAQCHNIDVSEEISNYISLYVMSFVCLGSATEERSWTWTATCR